MNFVDHLATTCGFKVRSYSGRFMNGDRVPAIIIPANDLGKAIQKLLDNNDEIVEDNTGELGLRRKQWLQHLRWDSIGVGDIVIYPQWFPMTPDEVESLEIEDGYED